MTKPPGSVCVSLVLMDRAYTQPQGYLMSALSSRLKPLLSLSSSNRLLSFFCTHTLCLSARAKTTTATGRANAVSRNSVKAPDAAVLKENWLDSLSCPFPERCSNHGPDSTRSSEGTDWVIGIDPDLSGALALLKTDKAGCSAQVFDTPHLPMMVSNRVRRRLDAKSIVQLLRSLDAPIGTTAYVEQSIPYPQDGKQGWWSGGFGYGLWIGILVASGFSVVPVSSLMWKNEFQLSGGSSTKNLTG